jgi:hypothetical protein
MGADDQRPELGTTGADVTAAVACSIASLLPIPGISQALQEIVSKLVPNQREERFARYLQLLSTEIDSSKFQANGNDRWPAVVIHDDVFGEPELQASAFCPSRTSPHPPRRAAIP